MIRSISKLHQKNKDEHRQKFLAEKELREINKELGIKPVFQKRPKVEKKETKSEVDEIEENSEEPVIGEWSTVETSKEVTRVMPIEKVPENRNSIPKPSKKQSAGDLETKNWDLNTKKQIDTFSSDDEDKPKPTLFKKRKIKKTTSN